MKWFRNFAITLVLFMAIDLVWLGLVAQRFYQLQLGTLMSEQTNWMAAIVFYLFYIVGISFFVIYPALNRESWSYALGVGLFFGFITYMTYDLTNLATLRDWPLALTLIDICWGTILGGATAFLSYWLIRRLP